MAGTKKYNAGQLSIGVALGLEGLEKSISEFQRKMGKMQRQISQVGKSLSLSLTAPIAGIGIASAKAAIDFESAFAGVRKTVNATEKEFKVLEKGILDMSKRLPASANDIAKVAENAGQLGIEKKNILAFTETMIRLGDSTNVTADEASIALAQLANVTKLPQTEFSNLASAIVDLGNNSATLESNIVEMASRLGAAASQAGLTHGEIIGLSAALASTGVEAEAGGSAMIRVFDDMKSAVVGNSEVLQEYSRIAGTDFKQAFEKDVSGAFTSFIAGLKKIQDEGGDVTAALESVGINSVRTKIAVKNLSQDVDGLAEAFARGNISFAENQALTYESEQRYKTLASQLSITKNNLVALGVEVGGILTPFVSSLNSLILNVTKSFSGLSTSAKKAIIAFGAVAATIGPLLVAVGGLIAIFGSFATLLAGGVVVALGTVVAGFVYFRENIAKTLHNIGEANNEFWSNTFPEALNSGIRFLTNFANSFKNTIFKLIDGALQPFADAINLVTNSNIQIKTSFINDFEAPLIEITKYQKREFIPTQEESAEITEVLADKVKSLTENFQQGTKTNNNYATSANNAAKGQEKLNKALGKAPKTPKLIPSTAFNNSDTIDQSSQSLQRLPEFIAQPIVDSLVEGFKNGFSKELATDFGNSIASVFANSAQESFRNIFTRDKNGEFANFTLDNLYGAAASAGLSFGVAGLTELGAKNQKDQKTGALYGAATGAAIGTMILPGIGTAVGAGVGGLGGFILGSHGKSNNPDTKARHETINFIEDAISSAFLPFLKEQGNIIEGDSRRFNTQGFGGGFFSSGVRSAVNALSAFNSPISAIAQASGAFSPSGALFGDQYFAQPGQIQGPEWGNQYANQYGQDGMKMFDALGAAMLQFAGQSQDTFSQVGVILAENLMGNLDNARMLLQTMNIGAKELEESFIQMGLSGEQSWHTVETFLQQIPALTGEGLSGFGDIKGAIDDLRETGGRGQAALISLQNLAVEAAEKGITSLAQLKQEMLSSGEFSAEEVNIIFQALDQRGISTLEGIKEASDRLLGGVVADLESLGFSWGEFDNILNQSALTLSQLQEKMNELNNRAIDVTVSINYEENNKPDFEAVNRSLNLTPSASQSTTINVDARGASPGVGAEVRRAIAASESRILSQSAHLAAGA